jgi:hypothetical protein
VVFKQLEDFDLAANLQLTWLRQNDSALLKEFVAATRQVASSFSLPAFNQRRESLNANQRPNVAA